MHPKIIAVVLGSLLWSLNAFGSSHATISDLIFTSDNASEITPDNAFSYEILEIDGKAVTREPTKGLSSSAPDVRIEGGDHTLKIEKKRGMPSHPKREIFELDVTVEAGKKYTIVHAEEGPRLVPLTDKKT